MLLTTTSTTVHLTLSEILANVKNSLLRTCEYVDCFAIEMQAQTDMPALFAQGMNAELTRFQNKISSTFNASSTLIQELSDHLRRPLKSNVTSLAASVSNNDLHAGFTDDRC